MHKKLPLIVLPLLAACGSNAADPRGVDRQETLLSVSATGRAEARPDEAQFQAGINSWSANAREASAANARAIEELVAALRQAGVPEQDIQTRATSIERIQWGDRKGQFQASNVVAVTVRNVDRAGEAITAATEAGANILSGPDLRMKDPEAAMNAAYAAAFKAAQARAEAYASAAGMRVARILTIRDAGGSQGNRHMPGAVPVVAPPPVMMEQASADGSSGRLMPGQTPSEVSVQVDFALVAE
jgi:uncharacterized protein